MCEFLDKVWIFAPVWLWKNSWNHITLFCERSERNPQFLNYISFLSELQNVLHFCKTGEYQGIEDLLRAFGFFNEYEEEEKSYNSSYGRYHHHEPKVDLKVKDEPLDSYDDDEDEDYDPNKPEFEDDEYDDDYATPKSRRVKTKVEYDDDYDDYDDDYWTPKKKIKTEDGGWITPKREHGGPGRVSLGEEEAKMYENWTWPQPLESYR